MFMFLSINMRLKTNCTRESACMYKEHAKAVLNCCFVCSVPYSRSRGSPFVRLDRIGALFAATCLFILDTMTERIWSECSPRRPCIHVRIRFVFTPGASGNSFLNSGELNMSMRFFTNSAELKSCPLTISWELEATELPLEGFARDGCVCWRWLSVIIDWSC